MKPSGSDNSRSLEIYEWMLRASKTDPGDPVAISDDALETEPGFAMGQGLCGVGRADLKPLCV